MCNRPPREDRRHCIALTSEEVLAIRKRKQRWLERQAPTKDARDEFVRRGGLHGAFNDRRYYTFRPWNWDHLCNIDGKGEGLPAYALRCPFGAPGDIVPVLEQVRVWSEYMSHSSVVEYRADGKTKTFKGGGTHRFASGGGRGTVTLGSPLMEWESDSLRWRKASSMPLAAARLFLRIVSVVLHRYESPGTDEFECYWHCQFKLVKGPNG